MAAEVRAADLQRVAAGVLPSSRSERCRHRQARRGSLLLGEVTEEPRRTGNVPPAGLRHTEILAVDVADQEVEMAVVVQALHRLEGLVDVRRVDFFEAPAQRAAAHREVDAPLDHRLGAAGAVGILGPARNGELLAWRGEVDVEVALRKLGPEHVLREHAAGDGELAAHALGPGEVELEHAEALRVGVDAECDVEAG